jgi:hypothetical protein
MNRPARDTIILTLAAIAVVAGAGCSSGVCTEIGCAEQGVNIHAPPLEVPDGIQDVVVTACLADRCSELRLSRAEATAPEGITAVTPPLRAVDPSFGRAAVSLLVEDPTGQELYADGARTRVRTSHPNGRMCPQTCVSGDDVAFS